MSCFFSFILSGNAQGLLLALFSGITSNELGKRHMIPEINDIWFQRLSVCKTSDLPVVLSLQLQIHCFLFLNISSDYFWHTKEILLHATEWTFLLRYGSVTLFGQFVNLLFSLTRVSIDSCFIMSKKRWFSGFDVLWINSILSFPKNLPFYSSSSTIL